MAGLLTHTPWGGSQTFPFCGYSIVLGVLLVFDALSDESFVVVAESACESQAMANHLCLLLLKAYRVARSGRLLSTSRIQTEGSFSLMSLVKVRFLFFLKENFNQ